MNGRRSLAGSPDLQVADADDWRMGFLRLLDSESIDAQVALPTEGIEPRKGRQQHAREDRPPRYPRTHVSDYAVSGVVSRRWRSPTYLLSKPAHSRQSAFPWRGTCRPGE